MLMRMPSVDDADTNHPLQFAKAKKLLESQQHTSITIHGLGAAINRSINLALELQSKIHIPLQLSTTTSTMALVDDVMVDELTAEPRDSHTQVRNNSAVHITLTKAVTPIE